MERQIKLLALIFIGIFMISMVSAWQSDKFEKDLAKQLEKNSKTNYGKYEIIESRWYDPLQIWTEKKTKDIVLEDNTDSCGQNCFAIQQINITEDSSLVDGVRFYRVYDDGSQSLSNIRSYKLLYKTEGQQRLVEDYEWQCVDTKEISKNGTKIKDCSNVKIGEHYEEMPIWTEFNEGDVFEAGNYTIKLEGEKRPNWAYDWQVLIGETDVWTEAWAVWGEGNLQWKGTI